MWSAPIKQALLAYNPTHAAASTRSGSSEGVGFAAKLEVRPRDKATTASFSLGEFTKVIDDEGQGGGSPARVERGRLALGGTATGLGYYNDPEKSEETWPTIDGRRYSIPGRLRDRRGRTASITLLGRGSACINSGGEKIYPEEVEEALKLASRRRRLQRRRRARRAMGSGDHGGGPDEGSRAITDEALVRRRSSEDLAAYKAPKHIVRVDRIHRGPNGKPDYRWATATAREALEL